MSMYRSRTYGAEEIRVFLQAVDRHLTRRVRVEIIGGSAAALAHGAKSTTTELDTFNALNKELLDAVARAIEETGFDIPVSQSTVADVPYNYEDRLERQLPELDHLEVWVLEKHDLVLSKTVRCYDHDLQQILESSPVRCALVRCLGRTVRIRDGQRHRRSREDPLQLPPHDPDGVW